MVNVFKTFGWEPARAICYSGFRDGQRPGAKYPSYEEVKEDLLLLQGHWKHLRLYDVDAHAEVVLKVIYEEGLDFKLQLGAYIEAEMNNFGCPWGGGIYDEEQLKANYISNEKKIKKLIAYANQYPDIIVALSVGNEACVDWTDHYVPVHRVIEFTRMVKQAATQPVTFCENYVPWLGHLRHLVDEVDFISIHTYPVWEYKHIHEAFEYTKENFDSVRRLYPNKPIVITEAGWATNSNGRGIDQEHVSEENQMVYFQDLMAWAEKEHVMVYFFEAFDEKWKGSDDPNEPEKHWGLFHTDRRPKLMTENLGMMTKI